jgi:hypothetical protein
MNLFKALLALQSIGILSYTLVVGNNHGWNLFEVFFRDILSLNWPGQFNLDFTFMLMLAGLWTAWRNRFSTQGLGLGAIAFVGGISFLAPYLLVLTFKHHGDCRKVLLGLRSEL